VKVADDLKTLQRQAAVRPPAPAPAHYDPNVSSYVPASTAALVSAVSGYIHPTYTGQMYQSHAGRVWSCPTCTYENPAQRHCCEMCGKSSVHSNNSTVLCSEAICPRGPVAVRCSRPLRMGQTDRQTDGLQHCLVLPLH